MGYTRIVFVCVLEPKVGSAQSVQHEAEFVEIVLKYGPFFGGGLSRLYIDSKTSIFYNGYVLVGPGA